MSLIKRSRNRRRLRSVLRRGHLSVALVAVVLASLSLTLLGILALKVYADHNLHLIARAINYTVEAAVVFEDKTAASEALALIASTEAVDEAKIYTVDGELLATGAARKAAFCRESKCCWPMVCSNSRSACRSSIRASR